MDSFFSNLTMGLFVKKDEGESGDGDVTSGIKPHESRRRMRSHHGWSGGSSTPTQSATRVRTTEPDDVRPVKRRRVVSQQQTNGDDRRKSEDGPSLSSLPEDILTHCLSFLGGVEDRCALQRTNTQFRRISNSDEMLIGIQVGGDKETGLNGIITEKDTPDTAADNLTPFVLAGNLEAIYMLGIIKCYCSQDFECGIGLLRSASSQGYVRASYALGLVLRDSRPKEAAEYMTNAAKAGYIPALQEVLPPRQMKEQYGEPKAEELRRHLDPLCLNRLLGRYYVKSTDLRELNTSHCWNPLCGRWAFKAVAPTGVRSIHQRRHAAHRRAAALSLQQNENVVLSDPSSFESEPSITTTQFDNESSVTPATIATLTTGVPQVKPPRSIEACISRMKMCSRCARAKYCSKLCQVYDWRSGRHKMECQFL